MKKPKKIFVWGPDLKPPKDEKEMHVVEHLREKPKKGEKLDKNWIEFRRVRRK